jgi:hypothetical protein
MPRTDDICRNRLGLPPKHPSRASAIALARDMRYSSMSALKTFVALQISPSEEAEEVNGLWKDPDIDAKPMRSGEHSPTSRSDGERSTWFTVKTPSASYSQDRPPHADMLPSDDMPWDQLAAGCWLPTDGLDKNLSPSLTLSGSSSGLSDLISDQGSDIEDFSSPPLLCTETYEDYRLDIVSMRLDEERRLACECPPIKSSHLDIGPYIASGRLYRAYKGTLTTTYRDDDMPPLTIPVVAKYVDLATFPDVPGHDDKDDRYTKNEARSSIVNRTSWLTCSISRPVDALSRDSWD